MNQAEVSPAIKIGAFIAFCEAVIQFTEPDTFSTLTSEFTPDDHEYIHSLARISRELLKRRQNLHEIVHDLIANHTTYPKTPKEKILASLFDHRVDLSSSNAEYHCESEALRHEIVRLVRDLMAMTRNTAQKVRTVLQGILDEIIGVA